MPRAPTVISPLRNGAQQEILIFLSGPSSHCRLSQERESLYTPSSLPYSWKERERTREDKGT